MSNPTFLSCTFQSSSSPWPLLILQLILLLLTLSSFCLSWVRIKMPLSALHLSIYPNSSLCCAQINNSVTSISCSASPVHQFIHNSSACFSHSSVRGTKWQIQEQEAIKCSFKATLNKRSMYVKWHVYDRPVIFTFIATHELLLETFSKVGQSNSCKRSKKGVFHFIANYYCAVLLNSVCIAIGPLTNIHRLIKTVW